MMESIMNVNKLCKLSVLLSWLILLGCPPNSYADSAPTQDSRIDPAYLIRTEVFGKWNENGRSGLLRYSMYQGGAEEVQTILVVDWITVDSTQGTKAIIASQEIIPWQGVFAAPKVSSENPYTLHVEVGTIICKERQRYDIVVTGIGKYKLNYLNKHACEP